MSLYASAKWLRCLLFAALLIAGRGSPTKGGDDVYVDLTKVGRLSAVGCLDDYSEDDTEYCTIMAIDGRVPPDPSSMLSPTVVTGPFYELLPGEHRIKVRNERDVQKEIVEMS